MSPSPSRPTSIDATVQAALAALQAGRLAEAEGLALGVLKSNWGHAGAAQVLGQAILLQGRPADAVDPMRRSARRSADAMTEALLGKALLESGQLDDGIAALRQAASRRPGYAPAFLELGDALRKARRFGEAAAVFEEGLTLLPEALVLQVGLGHVRLDQGDRAGARALFEAVRAAAPQRRDAMVGLANVLARDGEPAVAADLYRQALALRPDDAATQINLGRCLLELGEREAGEAVLKTAAQTGGAKTGEALVAMAAAPHGRFFLRPSAATRFLG